MITTPSLTQQKYLSARMLARVRWLREQQTPAEALLWECLRLRQLIGLKFRRQHTVQSYVLDFYCHEARLALELDGPIHDLQTEQDKERSLVLEELGITVLRFKNEDVLNQLEAVLAQIANIALCHLSSSFPSLCTLTPNPSPKGRGGRKTQVENMSAKENIVNQTPSSFPSPFGRGARGEGTQRAARGEGTQRAARGEGCSSPSSFPSPFGRGVRGEGTQRGVRGEGTQRAARGEGTQRAARGEGCSSPSSFPSPFGRGARGEGTQRGVRGEGTQRAARGEGCSSPSSFPSPFGRGVRGEGKQRAARGEGPSRAARGEGQHGFTLLEVMIALAILGLGLTAILGTQAGLFRSNVQARTITLVTNAARCKMNEVEQKLLREGYPELETRDEGACCNDESPPGLSCQWKIERVILPDMPVNTNSGSGSSDGGLGALGALATAATNPAALGDGGFSGLSSMLSQGSGEQGGMTGSMGIVSMAMTFMYPQLKLSLEASIRRVTVDVLWNEGPNARSFKLIQFVTNPQKGIPPTLSSTMSSTAPGTPSLGGVR